MMRVKGSARARISKFVDRNGVILTIPPHRGGLVMLFLAIWMVGWSIGGYFIGLSLIEEWVTDGIDKWFMTAASLGWLYGWVRAGGHLLWLLFGTERVIATNQGFKHQIMLFFLSKSRFYESGQIKHLRWEKDNLFRPDETYLSGPPTGHIAFDYGGSTIKVAKGSNRDEGDYLLTEIRRMARIG